ncbi:MAG: hypothetical protein GC168_07140 [Candidatus Hydrogenedens sp.]|nr:hypothetical protein [Candidatus Hydrogenedens sp.]
MKVLSALLLATSVLLSSAYAAPPMRVAVFQADVTPPVGTPLCAGGVLPAQRINDPLSARGIALLPEGEAPIVLCAVDWVGIANGAHDAWRDALAEAAGTTRERVAVHTLHQHDAPYADTTTEALVEAVGLGSRMYDPRFEAKARTRTAEALKASLDEARTVTAFSIGQADVEKVASNRRILGEDGKVRAVRWTATTDPAIRAEPEGVIDPKVRAIGLWDGDDLIVVLTYYATHPQSYYNTGSVSADFVGMARDARAEADGVPHVHFNGASGNIGAGKYNDGSPENRPVLAGRLADGMQRAWESAQRYDLNADTAFGWKSLDVDLPRRSEVKLEAERATLANPEADSNLRMQAGREIAWMERKAEHPIQLSCLTLGPARLVQMPGELFIEYQLEAQAMLPDNFVAMAAYGDYGPGYIGTAISYEQGGYETGIYTSRTDPEVETVLHNALETLLK